jgi:hypothetical protein
LLASNAAYGETSCASVPLATEAQDVSPYAALLASTSASYGNNLLAAGPESVARVVLGAVEATKPRSRYVVTPAARALIGARTFGGDRVWDAYIKRQFKV